MIEDESAIKSLLDESDPKTTIFNTISADEISSLMVEANLTKHQYMVIRDLINTKTATSILPCYQSVIQA